MADIPATKTPVLNTPSVLSVVNCNNDPFPDLVTRNTQNIQVIPGAASGLPNTNRPAPMNLGVTPNHLNFADLDGDGSEEMIAVNPANITVYGSNGGCIFQQKAVLNRNSTASTKVVTPKLLADKRRFIGVYDSGATTVAFFELSGSSIIPHSNLMVPAPITNIVSGDFNRDGTDDLATGTNVAIVNYGGNGNGAFLPPTSMVESSSAVPVGAGDITGDGATDLIWRNNTSSNIVIWTLDTNTILGPGSSAAPADFNPGGMNEIVVVNNTSVDVYSQSTAGFTKEITTGIPPLQGPANIVKYGDSVVVSDDTGVNILTKSCNSDTGTIVALDKNGQFKFVDVSKPSVCTYTITSTIPNPFVAFPTGVLNGSRTIVLSVPPNNTGNTRVNTLLLNGAPFALVEQSKCSGKFTPSTITTSGSSFTAMFDTEPGCSNLFTDDQTWINRSANSTSGGPTSITITLGQDFFDSSRTGSVTALQPESDLLTKLKVTQITPCNLTFGTQNFPAGSLGATLTTPVTSNNPQCNYNAKPFKPIVDTEAFATNPDRLKTAPARDATGNTTFSMNVVPNRARVARTAFVRVGEFGLQVLQQSSNPVQFFEDVPPSHPFSDFVNIIADAGVTSGCSATNYCPNDLVTRGQMAVFLIRSRLRTNNFTFSETPYFTDVPANHIFFRFIQKLFEMRITAGCSATQFCPDQPVTRAQMAVFIVRAAEGLTPDDPVPSRLTPFFADVPENNIFFTYIQMLKQLAVTAGCTASDYCPNDPVTRGQMAVFLSRGLLSRVFGAQ